MNERDNDRRKAARIERFVPGAISRTAATPISGYSRDLIRSRDLLVRVLEALELQHEALTVVGAHAVLERTGELGGLLLSDSTRDADVGVTPELLSSAPLLADALGAFGLEPANGARPGVWGLSAERERETHDRLTIDLIAPASLAGSGRRAARVGAHGARSVSKTVGTELTTIDRTVERIETFDGGRAVDAYVAGHAALLCAKAWKLADRLDGAGRARNPERLRTKDAGDIYRLMATSDPRQVRATFGLGEAAADIGDAVRVGRRHLRDLREPLIDLTVRHYRDVLPGDAVHDAMEGWLDEFEAAR